MEVYLFKLPTFNKATKKQFQEDMRHTIVNNPNLPTSTAE